MEAIIKVPSSEFTEELFKKIVALIKNRDAEITIAVNDTPATKVAAENNDLFWLRLKNSVTEIEEGKGIILTMSELEMLIKE